MMRRQADEEGAAVANLGAVPGGAADNAIARKAATAKSRTKALARRLRKSSRMASLTADVSENIEQIAGYSDGIIESFEEARHLMERIARESREGVEFRRTMTGGAVNARTVSGEASVALGDLAAVFSRHKESLRGILSLIQSAAQVQNNIQKQVQDLAHLNEPIDTVSSRLSSLLERVDISGLNATLEAGRAGESGTGFALVASMLQKASSAFGGRVSGAPDHLERMKAAHGSLLLRTAATAERIQAIGVMTKGVRNAFTEAEGVLDELCAEAAEIADRALNALEGIEGDSSFIEAAPEMAERAAGSIELAVTRLGDQEQRFAEAADRAEQLLASTGRLVSSDDLSGALDSIYTDTDTFIRSIETTLERLDLSLAAIHAAGHEMELLRSAPGVGAGSPDHLVEVAEGLREAGIRLRDRTTVLRENLGAALAVLGDVARELTLLGEESEAVGGEVATLRPLYRGITRLAGQVGAFAGRLDLLAVTGGMEASRVGEAGSGFAALPGEFEAAAADATELEQAVCVLCDSLDDHLYDMTGGQGKLDWRGLSGSFDRLIEGMQDLLELHLAVAEEKSAALADALAGFHTSIRETREKIAGMDRAAGEAIRVIGEAGNSGESQRTAFRRTIAAAEKISTLADELYPEEE